MYQVAAWLEDAEVELTGWDNENHVRSPDIKTIRKLEGSDLALLLAIAYRQHDEEPDGVWKAKECFCIGSELEMEQLSRLNQWKFRESRAFLQFMELISYNKSEDGCIDLNNHHRRKRYRNVYRLNTPFLASLKTSTKGSEDQNAVDEKLVANCEKVGDQLQDSCPPTTDYTEKNKKSSSKKKNAAAAKDDESKRAEWYREQIVRKWGLTEQQGNEIDLAGLVAGISHRSHDKILEVIDSFANNDRIKKNKISMLAGSLVNALKKLPKTSEPPPSIEELEKQFSPAQPILAPQDVLSRSAVFKAGFDRLKVNQHLADATKEQENEIKEAFKNAFASVTDRRLDPAFDTFINKLPPPVDDVAARCSAIVSALNKVAS